MWMPRARREGNINSWVGLSTIGPDFVQLLSNSQYEIHQFVFTTANGFLHRVLQPSMIRPQVSLYLTSSFVTIVILSVGD
ncbi:hypothetical protein RRG08_029644 [Elysia crispata]|uniref:Uncharacterized protein n=1 Tax=Elysia crispata TaxID=231223 RepID=A0AAE0XPA5_9GAST|nr:hypothetical protein RRG08_029644 [Elysia crispata]